jgi:N-acetylglucosamine kinase-like BadF-type ATPase
MILIADSGSGKTDWALLMENTTPIVFETPGCNPFHCSQEDVSQLIINHFPQDYQWSSVSEVHFFGAGCRGEKNISFMRTIFSGIFHKADIHVSSDLHAAGIALFGQDTGIVCILGTGSSSAMWDGSNLKQFTPSLGYVLGDEGSGSQMGIKFLKAFLRGEFKPHTMSFFSKNIQLSEEEILHKIYREKDTKSFLASFVPLMEQQISDSDVRNIIKSSFREFISAHLLNIPGHEALPIGFCGSPAYFFRDILNETLEEFGFSAHRIIRKPIDGLIGHFAGTL